MFVPKISAIIPAASEEKYLPTAIASLKADGYSALEIIVVVNGAKDKTAAIAKEQADIVLEYPQLLGYGGARNEGAKVATGEILVFMDADIVIEKGTLSAIVNAIVSPHVFGTVRSRPDLPRLKYRIFFFVKYILQVCRISKIIAGIRFCHVQLFHTMGGYNAKCVVDENYNFNCRALAAGGQHVFVDSHQATVSMRRFEQEGFLKMGWFWILARLHSLGIITSQKFLRGTYTYLRQTFPRPQKRSAFRWW